MEKSKLEQLALELAKDIKTAEDLGNLSKELTKITVEAALKAELDDYLGYESHDSEGNQSGNSRNGYTPKTLKGDHGEISINTPRDRQSNFTPQLVKKGQTRITGMDEQILSL